VEGAGKLILIVASALKKFFKKFEKSLPSYKVGTMAKNSNALEPRNFSLPHSATTAGVTLFDREDPESLINCCDGSLRKSIEAVEQSKEARRIIKLGEKDLRDTKPSAQDSRLRISFWDEHGRSLEMGHSMKLSRIYAGIVSKETFEENYLCDPVKMAYLLNTPPAYYTAAQEILLTGVERLRDIIELPLINAKGQVQAAVISGILKAVDLLDKRIHGASLQRIAVHQHHTAGGGGIEQAPEGALASDQLALLEKQIADVRKKLGEKYAIVPGELLGTKGGAVVEVEVVSDEET